MNQTYRTKPLLILLSLTLLLVLGVAVVSAGPASTQTADAFTFTDPPVDVGEASLLRNNNGVTTQITLDGAEPGVYTMWWVVWNTPEGCGTPWACNEPDLFNANAGLAIGYAGGTIVDSDGELHIAAHLNEGATLTRFAYPEFQGIGLQLNETTMVDSRHAEIHLVVRYHGEKVPGLVSTALHTFNGACVYDPPIAGSEPAYGTPGPNSCVDVYFAVFGSSAAP